MATIRRTASAAWSGDLRKGNGRVSSASGVLKDVAYSFSTRFENEPGTNPEELIAAAHAACYSMALSALLGNKGFKPERIDTQATCVLTRQESGGWKITGMELSVTGRVPGLDQHAFEALAHEADMTACPVSILLRNGTEIRVEARLA